MKDPRGVRDQHAGGPLSGEPLADLYERYGARLYRHALLILANTAAAEDAVQEAFCRIVGAAKRNPDALNLAYATRVVRNECYTLLRKRRRLVYSEEPLIECAAAAATEEERMVLNDALKNLPPEQREVVYLKVFEGHTFIEIAELCDTGINTAASRYRYAMASLRRAMESKVTP